MGSSYSIRKAIGASITGVGAILCFIASFLKYLTLEIDSSRYSDSEKLKLKELSDYAEDLDKSTFNPQALFIILSILAIIAAVGIFVGRYIHPIVDKICEVVAILAGTGLLITVLVYGAKGALGDVKEAIDDNGERMARAVAGGGEITASFGAGYILMLIGCGLLLIGSICTLILEFITPAAAKTVYRPAYAQPYGQPYAQPYAQPVQQPYAQPAQQPQQYAQPAPQQYAQPAPQQYAQPAPQQYAQPAPQQYAQPAPQQYAQPAPQQYAQPAPQQYAQPAPQQYAQPAPQQPVDPNAQA